MAAKAGKSSKKFRPVEDDDSFDLNAGAPKPIEAKAPEIRPQIVQEAHKPVSGTTRSIPAKGSRKAPERQSTLDAGDGRSRRARGRNSRISTNTLPEHCDAFKIACDEREGRDYCEVLEEMIAERWPDLVAERKKFYDELYGRLK